MTKKEQEPRKDTSNISQETENLSYNPEITPEDKEVLNNQSQDEGKGEYFEEREEPIDFEGEDLDITGPDTNRFNAPANEPDEAELIERPKQSANDLDSQEADSETIYKGEEAERYKDPSEKSRKEGTGDTNGKRGGIL